MNWVHAIGLYIVIGVIVFGLGMLAKVHMGGKVERSVPFVMGMVIGVLLWPFVLTFVGIAWKIKRKTRKVERLLGYCAHATPWEPYCKQCQKDIEREKDNENFVYYRAPSAPAEVDRPPDIESRKTHFVRCKMTPEEYATEADNAEGAGELHGIIIRMLTDWRRDRALNAEMLEALKHLRSVLGPTPGCSSMKCEGCRAELEEALETITKTIAKAEGR